MKIFRLSLLAFMMLISLSISGQDDVSKTEETGTIYFLRSTGFAGSASAFKMFIDDEFTCKLNNKRYSIHEVPAGKHLVSVQFGGKKSKEKAEKLEIVVEPGKITYVQVVFETGAFVNNVLCEEVLEKTAVAKMEKMKEDKKCL